MKSVISSYMIFVKKLANDVNVVHTQVGLSKQELDLSNFLSQYQHVFINDIPRVLPPKRGDDDHMIELLPGSSPPNKAPYRVSQLNKRRS